MGRTLMLIGALLLLWGGVLWLAERFLPGLGLALLLWLQRKR